MYPSSARCKARFCPRYPVAPVIKILFMRKPFTTFALVVKAGERGILPLKMDS